MPVSSIADPLVLLGRWRMTRDIEDRLAGTLSRIDGTLLLGEERPGRLRWEETGRWHRPDGDVEVHRSLRLAQGQRGWWMLFEDGRDFHPWLPERPVVHDCHPDTYGGLVSGTPERWTVRWEVTGPQKDYSMTAELLREP